MFGFLFSVILWPVAFLWNALRDAVSALVTMGHDPRVGLLDLASVVLRLSGVAGLVASVVLAILSPARTWSEFVASGEGRVLLAVALLSLIAAGVGKWVTVRANSVYDESEYRRYVRMQRRVEQEESGS